MAGILCVWIANIALMMQVAAGAELDRSRATNAGTDAAATTLTVIDEAGTAHSITPDGFSRLPQQSAKVTSHGSDAKFEGASLVELLKASGVKFGTDLRGRRTPTVTLLEATDGYRVAITLLEIDPETTDKVALVADRRDGKPLSDKEGPYRLILPGDKREVRWIRNLRTIRILNLREIPLDGPLSKSAVDGQK